MQKEGNIIKINKVQGECKNKKKQTKEVNEIQWLS